MRLAGGAVRKQRGAGISAPDPRILPDPKSLLAWYDKHRRRLPWRAEGVTADPYHVWLSEIMLQQTTVKGGRSLLHRLPEALADRAQARGRAARRCAEGVGRGWATTRGREISMPARRRFQRTMPGFSRIKRMVLRALPGIGAYTAAAIAAIAFDSRAVAIDGNIERVITRLFAIETVLPAAKVEIKKYAETLVPMKRPGGFTQAMMDLGATICTPKKPACGICPWMNSCTAQPSGGRSGDVPSQASEGRRQASARCVVRRQARRWACAGAQPPHQGLAWRHDRGAIDRMDAGVR